MVKRAGGGHTALAPAGVGGIARGARHSVPGQPVAVEKHQQTGAQGAAAREQGLAKKKNESPQTFPITVPLKGKEQEDQFNSNTDSIGL